MTETSDDAPYRVAAIPLVEDLAIDALLAKVVAALRAEGVRVAGFRQGRAPEGGMAVEDLTGGGVFSISQDLGPGSQGCKLDPQGLAEAACAALAALETGPDLLILPRFGKAEVEGHGFRSVIERACERQVPVLVAVKPDCTAAWTDFTGGVADRLVPERAAVLDWCRAGICARV
ncbi:DUF2478 domain-containing protein [Rhodovulum visakhapatnamense]|uniref:Uncharacterized protein DUF2478 n=1 Tax=Rhodovulum visakhapatnamense TaxID=364297 RepID=A0A4R8FS11_9RHOB|nr:DUF2478 domain-containing protein [Rhodovulum visakhapatnamense]TDX28256.1 uncharacterized protein DUF2478 [Rhodovulum visakhapatnamense]